MLIDTHCHLNFNRFDEDRTQLIQRAKEAGVVAFINPGLNLEDSRQAIALAEKTPELYAAVGFHPNDTTDFTDEALEHLRQLAKHPKVVAIGEIGLDYYWDKTPRPVQMKAFEQQLALAKEVDKPVIIHQRDSAEDMKAILRQWGAGKNHPGLVLHSFFGELALAEEYIELGFYISISGPVTFTNNRLLPPVVAALPPDCLLVETDSPFLTPHPFRGKRNEPARVKLVAECVAKLQKLSMAEMSRQLTNNTISLFKRLNNIDRKEVDDRNS